MKRKMMTQIYKAKNRMPNWIDTTLKLHYKIWNVMGDCNNIIVYNLLIDEVLLDDEIDAVIQLFDANIRKVLETGYDLEIAVYYEVFTKFCMDLVLEWEHYEAAHNLNRMIKEYFNTKHQGFNNE
jgi:hypothetical protein